MNSGLFVYPKQAEFGRIVPKSKIYEHAHVTASLKRKFIDQIERIVWQYKLAPETVNLPAKKHVPEIEVFSITVRTKDVSEAVLRCIDNAIPFPVIYELVFDGSIKMAAAYKRPSEGDSQKWVTDIYFESGWVKINTKRKPLPVALDLARLYEYILQELMPVSARPGEAIKPQVERLGLLRTKENEAVKLETQIQREKQFNRKVELNAELRKLNTEIQALKN